MAKGTVRECFVDLDGVLGDFRGYVKLQFGLDLDRNAYDPPGMWERINAHEGFWASMPPLYDALTLWQGLEALGFTPRVLTGISTRAVKTCELQKRWWVGEHISRKVRRPVDVIVCESKDKRLHGQPGDILIDDWVRYQGLWEEMGGVFVLHTSAEASLAAVRGLLDAEAGTSRRRGCERAAGAV